MSNLLTLWLASLVFVASAHSQTNSPLTSFTSLSKKAAESRDSNQLQEATKLYSRALKLRPDWEEGWWSLGTLEYDQDHYSQAAIDFQKVVSLNSSNGTAHAMLGLCQFELGKDALALNNLSVAEHLGVVNNEDLRKVVLYHLGLLQLRAKLYASALNTFQGLAKNGVQTDEVAMGLAASLLMMQASAVPAENAVGHIVMLGIGRAEILSTLRKAQEARQQYLSLLQQYPVYPGLHFAYGLFLASDEPEEAIKQMQAELRINPANFVALLQIAAILVDENPSQAIEYSKKALAINQHSPYGHFLLGQSYLKNDDAAAALPELELARRSMKNQPQVYFALGNAYAELGRKQEAAQARKEFSRLQAQKTNAEGDGYSQQEGLPLRTIAPHIKDAPRQ